MRVNKELVEFSEVTSHSDAEKIKALIEEHVSVTKSPKGQRILENFGEYLPKFKKIIPHDYKTIIQSIAAFEGKGLSVEEARIEAFYQFTREQ